MVTEDFVYAELLPEVDPKLRRQIVCRRQRWVLSPSFQRVHFGRARQPTRLEVFKHERIAEQLGRRLCHGHVACANEDGLSINRPPTVTMNDVQTSVRHSTTTPRPTRYVLIYTVAILAKLIPCIWTAAQHTNNKRGREASGGIYLGRQTNRPRKHCGFPHSTPEQLLSLCAECVCRRHTELLSRLGTHARTNDQRRRPRKRNGTSNRNVHFW